MQYKIVIEHTAEEEYRGIVAYLANNLKSKQALKNFIAEMDKIINLIKQNPENFGKSRLSKLNKIGYRKVNINNYLMLYKVKSKTVYISHIFHQSQDYGKLV